MPTPEPLQAGPGGVDCAVAEGGALAALAGEGGGAVKGHSARGGRGDCSGKTAAPGLLPSLLAGLGTVRRCLQRRALAEQGRCRSMVDGGAAAGTSPSALVCRKSEMGGAAGRTTAGATDAPNPQPIALLVPLASFEF
jgi:hypothetical protein